MSEEKEIDVQLEVICFLVIMGYLFTTLPHEHYRSALLQQQDAYLLCFYLAPTGAYTTDVLSD